MDDETDQALGNIRSQLNAQREILAWLLAQFADKFTNPEDAFRHLVDHVGHRVFRLEANTRPLIGDHAANQERLVEIIETLRREADIVIGLARDQFKSPTEG